MCAYISIINNTTTTTTTLWTPVRMYFEESYCDEASEIHSSAQISADVYTEKQ